MHDLLDTRIYSLIGEAGFERIVAGFYRRVKDDDLLGPMYRESLAAKGEGMDDARDRLRDFLVQRFGGPGRYSEARGHPMLRARHMGFPIDKEAAERWVALMNDALDEAAVTNEACAPLRKFFADVAGFLVNS